MISQCRLRIFGCISTSGCLAFTLSTSADKGLMISYSILFQLQLLCYKVLQAAQKPINWYPLLIDSRLDFFVQAGHIKPFASWKIFIQLKDIRVYCQVFCICSKHCKFIQWPSDKVVSYPPIICQGTKSFLWNRTCQLLLLHLIGPDKLNEVCERDLKLKATWIRIKHERICK